MTKLTITIESNGTEYATIVLDESDKSWYDVAYQNSNLNPNAGIVDDSAYNQLRCIGDGNEVIRLANCSWDTYEGFSNSGYCYLCNASCPEEQTWTCTKKS